MLDQKFPVKSPSAFPYGSVYFYEVHTVTPKVAYSNRELTRKYPNPLQLTGDAKEIHFGMEDHYRVVVKDINGATTWTADDLSGTRGFPLLLQGIT